MNSRRLKGKITENGENQYILAGALGIAPSTLNDKINGKSEFKQSEILFIKERYNLSAGEVDVIFFNRELS